MSDYFQIVRNMFVVQLSVYDYDPKGKDPIAFGSKAIGKLSLRS